MRVYELLRETFCRKLYIGIAHASGLAFYGLTYVLFHPEPEEFGQMLWICSGCLLPLVLSAGIVGDDIASGRVCSLVTKPFWPGQIYLCRLAGLSLQGAMHVLLAGALLLLLQSLGPNSSSLGEPLHLGPWLLASWLLFNVWAALSSAASVLVPRGYNSLLLFVALVLMLLTVGLVSVNSSQYRGGELFLDFVRYTCPPFALLSGLAHGEYGVLGGAAVASHSLALALLYGAAGLLLFTRRQFMPQSPSQ